MYLEFMTREVFDTLIFAVIFIGGAFALVRLYRDFTRPLPDKFNPFVAIGEEPTKSDEDTQPTPTHSDNIRPNQEE